MKLISMNHVPSPISIYVGHIMDRQKQCVCNFFSVTTNVSHPTMHSPPPHSRWCHTK